MSTTAAALAGRRELTFFRTTVGKKAAMAVSGVVLFGFVLAHLAGNLQIYEGPKKLDDYARFLRSVPALLWGARIVLLAMVAVHIASSVQLALIKRRARPIRYVKKETLQANYATRTMYWSGPIVLCFIVYHLLHLTFGAVRLPFHEGDVYANVVAGFQVVPVSLFYIVSMVLLGMHLNHGLWSLFQSLGLFHPRFTPLLKTLAGVLSLLIVVGNISIPISVLAGWVK